MFVKIAILIITVLLCISMWGTILEMRKSWRNLRHSIRERRARKALAKYKDFIASDATVAGFGLTISASGKNDVYCLVTYMKNPLPLDFTDTDKYPRVFEGHQVIYEIVPAAELLAEE